MQVGWLQLRLSTGIEVTDTLQPKICVHPPPWFSSTTVRWQLCAVINNKNVVRGSRSLLITLTAQLTLTTLAVVQVFVYHTDG